MTQSGQGEEPQLPAARPAHEGVVLPADGGEPLIAGGDAGQAVPAGGLPWGRPWGPGQDDANTAAHGGAGQAADGYGDGAYGGAGAYGAGGYGGAHAGTGEQGAPYGAGAYPDAYGQGAQGQGAHAAHGAYGQGPAAGAGLPGDGSPHYGNDVQYGTGAPRQDPGSGRSVPMPQGGDEAATQYIAPVPAGPGGLPDQQPQDPAQYPAGPPPSAPPGPPPSAAPGLPSADDEGATQLIPPVTGQSPLPGPMPGPDATNGAGGPQYHGGPLPDATSGAHGASGAHAAPGGAHAAAHQAHGQGPGPYPGQPSGGRHAAAPQQGGAQTPDAPQPGALPPEQPVDATQFLGRRSDTAQYGGPSQPPSAGPDAEATQYIAPVPSQPSGAPYGIRPGAPGDRQPPSEFDSLFRSEPAGGGADSTQQMPRFDAAQPRPGGPAGEPPYGRAADRRAAADDDSGRSGSKVPMIAAIGVAIALVGVAAGALIGLAGGDDDKDEPRTVAATDATESADPTPTPTTDPAKDQAVELDKLLGDSNNSRAAVIRSVELIKSCKKLPQAARDLRGAAKQRNGLVTRLAELKVDKIPDNAKLTAALNKAWKASASADNHYAAWAGETCKGKGKKKKSGQTPHKSSGDRQSGIASAAKKEAVGIWNGLADKYDLDRRQPVDL